MTTRIQFFGMLSLVTALMMSRDAGAADIAWFEPSQAANSNATIGTADSYTSNFGVAFLTGGSGPFTMETGCLSV
jgi:hypothetical protein